MMSTRRGVAFPGGDASSILSPRDSAGLGVKMVEYVLGGSPTGTLALILIYLVIHFTWVAKLPLLQDVGKSESC